MTPEGKVKEDIKIFLEDIGAWFYMPIPMGYGRKGIPDFIVCYKGQFIGIEAKAPGKEDDVTPWQEKELNAILDAGGYSYLISDVTVLKKLMYAIQ